MSAGEGRTRGGTQAWRQGKKGGEGGRNGRKNTEKTVVEENGQMGREKDDAEK